MDDRGQFIQIHQTARDIFSIRSRKEKYQQNAYATHQMIPQRFHGLTQYFNDMLMNNIYQTAANMVSFVTKNYGI